MMKRYISAIVTLMLLCTLGVTAVSAESTTASQETTTGATVAATTITTTTTTTTTVAPTTTTTVGQVAVTLTVGFDESGFVVVTATDINGAVVPHYQLKLSSDSMAGVSGKTGANGIYSRLQAKEGETVTAEGLETTGNGVIYLAAAPVSATRPMVTVGTSDVTTTETETTTSSTGITSTTVSESTSTSTSATATATTTVQTGETTVATTVTSVTATSGTTVATVKGAGTTAVEGDKIAVNVSLDETILQRFELSEKEFDKKGRMLISRDNYTSLVGRTSDILMLNVLTASAEATPAQVQAAVAGISKFSAYAEEQRSSLTFSLSLLILDKQSGAVLPVSALPINSTYTVQLPVPKSMRHCDMLAITMKDGDKLMAPQEVQVSNGCFQLVINSLEEYTLIGFNAGSGSNAGGISWWVVLLIVVGVLLIGGAGALLYFFVLRKPEPKTTAVPAVTVVSPTFDENDIFSGRTDISFPMTDNSESDE